MRLRSPVEGIGMKAFSMLFDIVPGWIWALVCVGLFGWGGINAYRVHSAKADLIALKYDHQSALIEGLKEGSRQSDHLQRTKDEQIAQAQTRAKENAVAAGRARTELDRLRQQASSGASAANTSHSACTRYAAAANTVLNECAGALVTLAETADGHVNDIRTLTGSWPAWDKFAAEMTSFTQRLKGTP